jgi:hypothetical protein
MFEGNAMCFLSGTEKQNIIPRAIGYVQDKDAMFKIHKFEVNCC